MCFIWDRIQQQKQPTHKIQIYIYVKQQNKNKKKQINKLQKYNTQLLRL